MLYFPVYGKAEREEVIGYINKSDRDEPTGCMKTELTEKEVKTNEKDRNHN